MADMNTFPLRQVAAVGSASVIFLLSIAPALAVSPGNSHAQTAQQKVAEVQATIKADMASREAELQLRVASRTAALKEKLAGVKLQACENRQSAIQTHIQASTTAATRLVGTFDSIATRVESFKTDKNISVPNYDMLVADVAAKKQATQTAITAAQSQGTSFTCTSDGPKAQLQQFVTTMDTVGQALKDYKTAVKNLIQGVRQANGQNRQATASATPSATPMASMSMEDK